METNVVMLDVRKMDKKTYPNQDGPIVNLCGKWFSDAGFEPGDSAVAEVFDDAILIRKVKRINANDLKVILRKINE
jgi:hypothetical protein